MKKFSISIIALALTMAFSGCSDRYDMPEPATPQLPAGTPVRISASMEPQTRLGIEDTETQLVFAWQESDSLRVYSASNPEGTCFTIDPDAERVTASLASFVGTPVNAFQEGEKLYAVFDGSGAYTLDEDGNLVININGQNGTLNQNYQYLYGEAVYHEGEAINFSLKHVVTMMKYCITLPEGVSSLKELQIGTNNWELATQATLVLRQSPSDYSGKLSSGMLVSNRSKYPQDFFSIKGEFLPDETGAVTIYAYLLPASFYYTNWGWCYQNASNPLFTACDDEGKVYVSTALMEEKTFEAGKTYRVASGLRTLAPFDNELDANAGESDTPYLISTADQLYSFMYRSLYGMSNGNGCTYNTCSYRLTQDIELNDECPWVAVNYNAWNGMFDGAGHSLKGNITFGLSRNHALFSNIQSTTVSALTLDFDRVTLSQKSYSTNKAMLATEVNNSVIVGCVNRSKVEMPSSAYRLAGLIGYSWNSTIAFCSNTGEIRSNGDAWRVGGIVADANYTRIEGCYNTGAFYVQQIASYDKVYVGGVVGIMDSNQPVMVNCWSNSTLQIEDMVYDDHFNDASGSLFVGGLAGWSNGTIQNCFWNAGIDVATNGNEAVDCASFAGTTPDAAQIDLLNAQIAAQGWKFNENGTLEASKETTIPSLPKEEW